MKDILVPVFALEEDEAALRAAMDLAAKFDARVIVLVLAIGAASPYADEVASLSKVLDDIAEPARSEAASRRAAIAKWLERAPVEYEIRDITVEAALISDEILAHARLADLIVITRTRGDERARRELFSDVLFKSGRPVLLIPPDAPASENAWNRIVIAWDAKPQAVRAIAAAMPLLRAAEAVRLVTVDARPSRSGHGQAPGSDVAAYLARRGVRVEVHNVDGLGRSAGRAIADCAVEFGADVIVMGGYGHSRAREIVFGGVTRDLVGASTTPLFLAH
ncbi:MAG: universal stress protein [Proteobacteria bacterium]|nr:universal stress protein [Pseudomonadota bacterium]